MACIPLRDQKLLWIKSGNMCAFTDCRRQLAIEVDQSGGTSIVSQEAHIVADSEDGPRGTSPLSQQERNSYPNLILLCLEHHKIVDDHSDTFTVDSLLAMKTAHEQWFSSLRSPADTRRDAQELLMIDILEEWEHRADIEGWPDWMSTFLRYHLSIDTVILTRLRELDLWLYTRAWPDVYPVLLRAFENLRRIASTLVMVIECAFDRREDGKAREYVPDHKRRLLEQGQYEASTAEASWIRDLVGDLALELTRAANWVLDEVRLSVDPRYQNALGVLIVEREEGLSSRFYKARYRPEEVIGSELPFRGLREFIDDRARRDWTIGAGFNEDGWRCVTPFDPSGDS